jgi:glycosyltransferase involved in cell wall biosynthesis
MKLDINKHVLLFYRKHEHDYPSRDFNRTLSGFMAWYVLLVKALTHAGFDVIENDFKLARANPAYPVGLVGTPIALKNWDLPNPAILGPCMLDHPRLCPDLMQDSRFQKYLVTCEWLQNVFQPFYGAKCARWNAGIDLEQWPDRSTEHKDIDVLIYDKIQWTRDVKKRLLVEPILVHIRAQGLNQHVLEYGNLSHAQYADFLSRSKAMIFLSEHETQGMAYQEALASNVPVLAWDPGYWVDPLWEILADGPVPATSVPLFSAECGLTFARIFDFEPQFKKFLQQLGTFKPREFVAKHLSLSESAEIYHEYYRQAYGC